LFCFEDRDEHQIVFSSGKMFLREAFGIMFHHMVEPQSSIRAQYVHRIAEGRITGGELNKLTNYR